MLPKTASDILFSLIKDKTASDFKVWLPHCHFKSNMRRMQYLVAYEAVINWKQKLSFQLNILST